MRCSVHVSIMLVASALLAGCGADQPTSVTDKTAPGAGIAARDQRMNDQSTTDRRDRLALPPAEDFVAEIDNPYLAFERGKVFRYRGDTADGVETIVVEVTRQTEVILGVATTVVHDRAYLDGDLIEDTFDWYAQDENGNVWYFGEASSQIDQGRVVGTEGSWRAGVDGARPGIVMFAEPSVGQTYQQEFAPDVAEDMAKVLSLHKTVRVAYGHFRRCLETTEWTPLEPGVREFKFYARGVGLVLESERRGGGGERIELISIEN